MTECELKLLIHKLYLNCVLLNSFYGVSHSFKVATAKKHLTLNEFKKHPYNSE